MKNLFILAIALFINIASFAQRITNIHAQPARFVGQDNMLFSNEPKNGRTTAIGDTFTLTHITPADTTTLYTTDSGGYVTGTDFFGDKAFAEQYSFNGYDTSMQVIGVFALFGGTVSNASTATVTFDVWNIGNPQPITGSLIYNGFPGTVLDTLTVPVTQIGIHDTVDSIKQYMFAAPTPFLPGAFFVGYNISYTFNSATGTTATGDDFGLMCSKNGERKSNTFDSLVYNMSDVDTTLDTVINVQNATLGADNTWYDNYTQNDSLANNLAIYPIVVIGYSSAGVSKITRNNLTFYGNYPNPAVDNTNIKFSLAQNASVTIQVMDMNGRIFNTIQQPGLAAGDHVIPLSVSAMPAGDYLYLIRTSGGDGIAGKITKM